MRTTTLENSQIVLFQMQVFIWHDNNFCGTFPFHGLKTLAFFILQQPNHCGMGADDDPLWLRAAADPADIAEYLICYRSRRLRIASAFAIVTSFGKRPQEVLSHPFTRNLDQPKVRDSRHSGAGFIA